MQKQRIRKTITKALLVGSLIFPLVSHADEYFSSKSKVSEVRLDVDGRKDTLTGKTEDDTILVKLFEAARNRLSRVVLNPIETIDGFNSIETRRMFSDSCYGKMMEIGTSGNILFPNISKAMMKMSLKCTGNRWGFCLTEEGIRMKYDGNPEYAMKLDLCKDRWTTNLIYAMNEKKTRVYYSKLNGYDYGWISASCERVGKLNVPCQYLVLAFPNLYPDTPEEDVWVLAALLKISENWRVIEERSLLGVSCCDVVSPSAYFVAEDSSKKKYEILMLGNSELEVKNPKENIQVFIRDEKGTIFEVK